MITVGFSTREDNKEYIDYLKKTSGVKNVQVIQKINNGEKSLAQVYNEIIDESEYDIVVLVHDDIKLETNWGKILIKDFNSNPEFSIIGKAGSCYFPESGIYWERIFQTMVGQVYHHPKGQRKWLSKYSPKLPFLVPVVTIDGLFISFDKNKIKHRFDETIGKFHFYDHSFCLPNFLDGVKIGVTSSFEITHESVGQPNNEFFVTKEKFLEKYKSHLPLDLKPEKIYIPEIKEKPLKNIGKVAVIIPTKGNVEMLFDCVNSFYQHCNSELFNVLIADTGSSDEEKKWIKENILPLGNIKLIEYNYYNFAKINNDVVKNHVGGEYEFILFSNNDIKVLNNVIYGMLKIFKENKNVGTVGCRLHFKDNTIQHDGVAAFFDKENRFQLTHQNLTNYYNHNTSLKRVIGNTGGLMMIKKSTFINLGLFNESYTECFEDVELNLKCLISGFDNYVDGNIVSYHYESVSRNESDDKLKRLNDDYKNNLYPFVNDNMNKLSKYLINKND